MGKIYDRIKNKSTNQTSTRQLAVQTVQAMAGRPDKGTIVIDPASNYQPRSRHSLEDWEVSTAFDRHKYIVVEHPDLGEVALTFPNFLVHANMARRVFDGLRVVAAGFYYINDDKVHASGRSESLGVDSRGKVDDAIIERSLGLV